MGVLECIPADGGAYWDTDTVKRFMEPKTIPIVSTPSISKKQRGHGWGAKILVSPGLFFFK